MLTESDNKLFFYSEQTKTTVVKALSCFRAFMVLVYMRAESFTSNNYCSQRCDSITIQNRVLGRVQL